MPVKRIFVDAKGENQLEAYANEDGLLYISVGTSDPEELYHSGYIVLDRDDLDELIDHLMNLKDEVFNERDFADKE